MDDQLPPFSTFRLFWGITNAHLTVVTRDKRFHAWFTTADLRGPDGGESLLQKFLDLRARVDNDRVDVQAEEELREWMLQPCLPYIIQELKAATPKIPRTKPVSLAEYFNDEGFVLKLSNKKGQLEATPSPQDPMVTEQCFPRVLISSEPAVSEAISQGVLCIPASQLSAVLTDGVEPNYDSVPTTVRAEDIGDQFHFKPVSDRWSFMRELNILIRFRKGQVPDTLRVSRLAGLVVSEDKLSVTGFLVEYIPNSKPLRSVAIGASTVNRVKWIQQIRETVTELHSADIVWGGTPSRITF